MSDLEDFEQLSHRTHRFTDFHRYDWNLPSYPTALSLNRSKHGQLGFGMWWQIFLSLLHLLWSSLTLVVLRSPSISMPLSQDLSSILFLEYCGLLMVSSLSTACSIDRITHLLSVHTVFSCLCLIVLDIPWWKIYQGGNPAWQNSLQQ